jgi:HEAT repeat protein
MTVRAVLAAAPLAGLAALVLHGALLASERIRRAWRIRRHTTLANRARGDLLAAAMDDTGSVAAMERLVNLRPSHWAAVEPVLLGMLGKVRGDARTRLVQLFVDRGAVETAMRDLASDHADVRIRAAARLGVLSWREAVPALCRLLVDPDADVRRSAVVALGDIGDPDAAGPLLARISSRRPLPTLHVVRAVARLGLGAQPSLATAVTHRDPLVRATAVEIIGVLGAVGLARPVIKLLDHDADLAVRVRAAATLGQLGTPAARGPLLAATAAREPEHLRAVACRALGELGAVEAVPRLTELLSDAAHPVYYNAAEALILIGGPGIVALAQATEGRYGQRAAGQAREVLAARVPDKPQRREAIGAAA